jgi:predicted  nucleic acid-binding Zn-ribbon protein
MSGILQNLYKLQTLDVAGLTRSDRQVAGLRAAMPEGVLTNYDRARARGKKGIALVVNHVCMNCRMHVPVAVTASLTAGIIQACARISRTVVLAQEKSHYD